MLQVCATDENVNLLDWLLLCITFALDAIRLDLPGAQYIDHVPAGRSLNTLVE